MINSVFVRYYSIWKICAKLDNETIALVYLLGRKYFEKVIDNIYQLKLRVVHFELGSFNQLVVKKVLDQIVWQRWSAVDCIDYSYYLIIWVFQLIQKKFGKHRNRRDRWSEIVRYTRLNNFQNFCFVTSFLEILLHRYVMHDYQNTVFSVKSNIWWFETDTSLIMIRCYLKNVVFIAHKLPL